MFERKKKKHNIDQLTLSSKTFACYKCGAAYNESHELREKAQWVHKIKRNSMYEQIDVMFDKQT